MKTLWKIFFYLAGFFQKYFSLIAVNKRQKFEQKYSSLEMSVLEFLIKKKFPKYHNKNRRNIQVLF